MYGIVETIAQSTRQFVACVSGGMRTRGLISAHEYRDNRRADN